MPKVKMLKTVKGSTNGINVQEYEKGREYLLPDSLVDVFLSNEFAELVLPTSKVKSESEAPMNKAIVNIPTNKNVPSKSETRRKEVMFKSKLKRNK